MRRHTCQVLRDGVELLWCSTAPGTYTRRRFARPSKASIVCRVPWLFDMPYLVNRITGLLGWDNAKRLSPWKLARSRAVLTLGGREQQAYAIEGISQLDYLNLFKKFTLNTYGQQESYKLDNIANVVLGERKLS